MIEAIKSFSTGINWFFQRMEFFFEEEEVCGIWVKKGKGKDLET